MNKVTYVELRELMQDNVCYLLWYVASNMIMTNHNNISQYKFQVSFIKLDSEDSDKYKDLSELKKYLDKTKSKELYFYADAADLHNYIPYTIWKDGAFITNVIKPCYLTMLKGYNDYYYIPEVSYNTFTLKKYAIDDLTGQMNYVIESDKYVISIPVMEIVRFFYLSDSHWNKLVVSGSIELSKIINDKHSSFENGRCIIRLRNELFLSTVSKVALYFTSDIYRKNIHLIHKLFAVTNLNSLDMNMRDNFLTPPHIELPFSTSTDTKPNSFELYFLGRYKAKDLKTPKTHLTIYRIQEAKFDFPYNEIYWFRNITPNALSSGTTDNSESTGTKKSKNSDHEYNVEDMNADNKIPEIISSGTNGFPIPIKNESLKPLVNKIITDIVKIYPNDVDNDNNYSTVDSITGAVDGLKPLITGNDDMGLEKYSENDFDSCCNEMLTKLQDKFCSSNIKLIPITRFPYHKKTKKRLKYKNRKIFSLQITFNCSLFYILDISYNPDNNKDAPFPLIIFSNSKSPQIEITENYINSILKKLMDTNNAKKTFDEYFMNPHVFIKHTTKQGQNLSDALSSKILNKLQQPKPWG